jgi:hypothetical protein
VVKIVLDLKGCNIPEHEFLTGIGATTHQTLQVIVTPRGKFSSFSCFFGRFASLSLSLSPLTKCVLIAL